MLSTRKAKQGEGKAKKSKSGTATKQRTAKKVKAAAGRARVEATAGDGTRATAAAIASSQPKNDEEMRSLIEGIGAPALHDDDIATTLKHLNSVVAFRRAVRQPGAASKKALSGKCYLKSAGDPIVSIYEGFNHIDSMPESSAIALGIPRCGS